MESSIDGSLVANKAMIGPAQDDRDALIIDQAHIRGYVLLDNARINGSLRALDAQIGGLQGFSMWVSANPRRKDPVAVELTRSTVTGWVRFSELGAQADGRVVLLGSVVGGGVDFGQANIRPGPKLNQQSSGIEDAATEVDNQSSNREASIAESDAEALSVLVDIELTQIGSHLILRGMTVTDGRVLVGVGYLSPQGF